MTITLRSETTGTSTVSLAQNKYATGYVVTLCKVIGGVWYVSKRNTYGTLKGATRRFNNLRREMN